MMKQANKGQGITELLLVLGLLVIVGVFALPGFQGALVSAFSKISSAFDVKAPPKAASSGLLSTASSPLTSAAWKKAVNAAHSKPLSSKSADSPLTVKPANVQQMLASLTQMQTKLKEAQNAEDYIEVAGGYGELAQQILAMTKSLEAQAKQLTNDDPNQASLQQAARYGKALAGLQATLAVEILTASGIHGDTLTKVHSLSVSLSQETALYSDYQNDNIDGLSPATIRLPSEISAMAQQFEQQYDTAASGMLASGYNQAQKDTTDQAANSIVDNADVATASNALNTLQQSEVIGSVKKTLSLSVN